MYNKIFRSNEIMILTIADHFSNLLERRHATQSFVGILMIFTSLILSKMIVVVMTITIYSKYEKTGQRKDDRTFNKESRSAKHNSIIGSHDMLVLMINIHYIKYRLPCDKQDNVL